TGIYQHIDPVKIFHAGFFAGHLPIPLHAAHDHGSLVSLGQLHAVNVALLHANPGQLIFCHPECLGFFTDRHGTVQLSHDQCQQCRQGHGNHCKGDHDFNQGEAAPLVSGPLMSLSFHYLYPAALAAASASSRLRQRISPIMSTAIRWTLSSSVSPPCASKIASSNGVDSPLG